MMDANPSGTPTPLTNSAGSNAAPAWSPDGTKIAFTSTRDDGNLEIYVMDADGGNQTRLTNDIEWDYDPIWAPDGSRIAFSHGGNLPDIYVMNADGTGPVNLTPSPASADYSAAWSPDGTKIAFISDRVGNAEIYVMNADGSNPTNISNTLAAEGHPDWQPIPQPPTDVRHDVELLAEHVSQVGLPMGIARSLVAKLNEVLAAIDADDTTAACISLSDFIDKVRAQSGKKIAASDAADLIEEANAIADELGCDGCYPDLPAPQLVLESTTVLGEMVEFQLDVPNYANFPDDLFEPAPDLAPCGLNTSASRTWIDVLDGNGNYLYGFCSLGRASDLNNIWFATPVAQWPAEAYIRLTDRRCNITYTSNRINLAEIL
jgi:hypothetical protein